MPAPPVYEADHWRIRSDTTAAEGGTPTWETAEDDASALSWEIGTTFRIRFVVSETAGNASNNENWPILQYQIGAEGWNNVGEAGTTAEGVICDAAASVSADDLSITTYLLSAGQGSAAGAGYYWESNNAGGGDVDEPDANQYNEFEWGIILDGDNTNAISDGDSVTFRLATAAGAAITANYANVPTISAVAGATIENRDGVASFDISASGVGSAVNSQAGSANFDIAASGVSAAIDAKAGSANFDFVASGIGSSVDAQAGSASADIAASGVGASVSSQPGSANFDFVASGVSAAIDAKSGSANFDFVASGVGRAVVQTAPGSAAMDISASGVGSSIADSSGSAVLDIVASGAGASLVPIVGTASLDISALGVGASETEAPEAPAPAISTAPIGVGGRMWEDWRKWRIPKKKKKRLEELDELAIELQAIVDSQPVPTEAKTELRQAKAIIQMPVETTQQDLDKQVAQMKAIIQELDDEDVLLMAA